MRSNKKILFLLLIISSLFLSLIVYLTYFGVFSAPSISKSAYNQRNIKKEETVLRGSIYDKNGKTLAYSEFVSDKQVRKYPYGSLYTHLIGYSNSTYGKSELELTFNNYLSGDNDMSALFGIADAFSGQNPYGADLYLTIDHNLQNYASNLLGNRNGAIIVLNPEDNAVRALVSKPTFSPDAEWLINNWGTLTESENSPFVNRATAGLYAPGSTWKILTAACAIEQGMSDETFFDEGTILIDGKEYKNSTNKAYGELSLSRAFSLSSNVVFADLGVRLGERAEKDLYKRFMLSKSIDFDIPLSVSRLLDEPMSETDLASTAIGQGKLMVTPMYMALIASCIENDGVMYKPYVVDRVTLKNGINAYRYSRSQVASPISSTTAAQLREMMAECVKSGTGAPASVYGLSVYGKTGTAQNQTNKSHDWFVGFADAPDGDRMVVCVMLEYSGRSGSACAAMASSLFSYWLR